MMIMMTTRVMMIMMMMMMMIRQQLKASMDCSRTWYLTLVNDGVDGDDGDDDDDETKLFETFFRMKSLSGHGVEVEVEV